MSIQSESTRVFSVCVFCGSAMGSETHFRDLARSVGHLIAQNGLRLVYGGACIGLMGVVANAVIEKNGNVLGVMTEGLAQKEIVHRGLTELVVKPTMAERKEVLIREADLFLILPGGIGTLDEFFEVLTLNAVGTIRKPVLVFNHQEFYSPLIQCLQGFCQAGFCAGPSALFSEVSSLPALARHLATTVSSEQAD